MSVSYKWHEEGRPLAQKLPEMATGCKRGGTSCELRPGILLRAYEEVTKCAVSQ